jgi:kumamolisin
MAAPRGRDAVVTLIFKTRCGASEISTFAKAVSDPRSAQYGRYLTPAALARRVGPDRTAVAQGRRWATTRHLSWRPTIHPQAYQIHGSRSAVSDALGKDVDELLRHHQAVTFRGSWPLPEGVTAHLLSIVIGDHADDATAHAVKGIRRPRRGAAPIAPPQPAAPAIDVPGMTPADIREIYDIPSEWTGRHESIILLNLGARVVEDDLHAFWRRHKIDRKPGLTTQLDIGCPLKARGFVAQLEPTMGAQWIGALAPDARLCICNINAQDVADPWATFIAVAAAGDRGQGLRPTIAVSTWSLPERFYNARYGREVIAGLLEQAAAVGVTVIAASGDWGVYDGRPSSHYDDREVADAPWPHGVFPSVQDYVLSVGGTMITSRQPLTELAWSGPLPPNQELRSAVPFERLASSGGFAEDCAIPWWQAAALTPGGRPHAYGRGLNLPAVLPSGRGYPDVALMAQGSAVMHPGGGGLASVGYEAIVDGNRINYAGGTSVAAPIWAAITACVNQARRAGGGPRLGFANPLFYRLAQAPAAPERRAFRDVTNGSSDVELWVLDSSGTPERHLLEGFSASPDHGVWNPVTGLGVPNVRNLIAAVTRTARKGRAR